MELDPVGSRVANVNKNQPSLQSRLKSRLPLLEAVHGVKGVELLPALQEVDDARGELALVAQVDEGEVL